MPHDIFCPLSVARISDDGSLEGPNILEILTVDGEKGAFDEQNTLEAIAYLRRAFDETPDSAGLLTLLYPFSGNYEFAQKDNVYYKNIFFNDWFICNAINHGLPLNTVVNTDTFRKTYKKEIYNTVTVEGLTP
jgi:hypothetical protein